MIALRRRAELERSTALAEVRLARWELWILESDSRLYVASAPGHACDPCVAVNASSPACHDEATTPATEPIRVTIVPPVIVGRLIDILA